MRLRRSVRILASVASLIAKGRVQNKRLYLAANSRTGLYFTALVVLVGTSLGYTVYLHHHVYYYIDQYDWRMAWIDRRINRRGYHVVHAQKMVDDFRARYKTDGQFLILLPSVMKIERQPPRQSRHRPFRLGLLSNLSYAKGLANAIATFEELYREDHDLTLTLAGPVSSRKTKRQIENLVDKYPSHVTYVGPIYGAEKAQFFANIDVFLFPTQSESWGLVLNEALAAGVPAITVNRGCTAMVVGAKAGLVIEPDLPFVESAAAQVRRWKERDAEYCLASQAAVAQAEFLELEGQRSLANFVRHVFSDQATACALT